MVPLNCRLKVENAVEDCMHMYWQGLSRRICPNYLEVPRYLLEEHHSQSVVGVGEVGERLAKIKTLLLRR